MAGSFRSGLKQRALGEDTEVENGDGNSLEASRVMWEMFDTLIFSMESGHLGNAG